MDVNALTVALSRHMPGVLRWSGALARQLRKHNIAVSGKHSGSANTDALTLADLGVQELIVSALRDLDPLFRRCRIEAEETTGDLTRFSTEGDLVLAIDPIDGTKQYRDRTGNGYSVMLHLRNRDTVLYSLVYVPESGPDGTWVEVRDGKVFCGPDDPSRAAADVLRVMPPVNPRGLADSNKIYIIGFQQHDPDRARDVTAAGLEGYTSDTMAGCIYELRARGLFGGSLIHSPNVYDFPVSLHIVRVLEGDAVWVHNRQPVNFHETWLDERANMIRLPGIVACCTNPDTLDTLCNLARDWNPDRYADEGGARVALAAQAIMKRVLLSWSSGKDSAWTLHLLRQETDVEVVGLLTTFNETADRVAMHAVRRVLVEAQAQAAGLPLWPILLPWPCSNDVYEARMQEALTRARQEGVSHIAFGDLFLEDIRAYREQKLAGTGIEPLFPVWTTQRETPRLARQMLAAGLRAALTCVDPKQLDARFVGSWFDADLLAGLPSGVDPCGERGEFHTFCCEGPMFSRPIPISVKESSLRDGFWFADVMPV